MKLLIVDDEIHICSLLERLIDWKNLNLSSAGLAHSGEEAYEKALRERPDIIITDICMPGEDGLCLISRIKNELPDIKFIVISGYREFDFVHRAMRLGVEDFLLKPIRQEDLNAVLSRICIQSVSLQPEFFQNDRADFARDRCLFLTTLIDSLWKKNDWSIADINGKYNYSFKPGLFQAMFIKISHPEFIKKDFLDLLTAISSWCIRALSPLCHDVEYNFSQNGSIHFVMNYSAESPAALREVYRQITQRVDNLCVRNRLPNYIVGIGLPFGDIGSLPVSFHSALFAAKACLLLGSNQLLFAQDILPSNDVPTKPFQMLDANFQSSLSQCVEFQDSNRLDGLIRGKLSEYDRFFQQYPGALFDLLNALPNLFYSCVSGHRLLSNYSANNKSALLNMLDNSFRADEATRLVIRSFTEELDQIRSLQEPNQHRAVSVAKQYILQNYQQQITLERIATLTYMNPVYLSTLFKKETGQNFSAYLHSVRIEKSKELLKDMKYSISQVAEMVGFSDAKYFSKLFLSITGARPKEYRQLYKAKLI